MEGLDNQLRAVGHHSKDTWERLRVDIHTHPVLVAGSGLSQEDHSNNSNKGMDRLLGGHPSKEGTERRPHNKVTGLLVDPSKGMALLLAPPLDPHLVATTHHPRVLRVAGTTVDDESRS